VLPQRKKPDTNGDDEQKKQVSVTDEAFEHRFAGIFVKIFAQNRLFQAFSFTFANS
jgi:hypothetical protein